jgi:CheY-like chemotaxis protein/HPt (histidine-containing phosphotransfer) domain-containing protein
MADLLGETTLDAEQRRYVEILRSAGKHLLGLVNDVLDLSHVESGHLTLNDVDFRPREPVEQTIELMLPRAREKRLEIQYRVSPEVPSLLCGDPQRLRQVLVNLVGNAIKYTERGTVKVTVESDPDGAEASALRFSVEDTGVGVPPGEREAIFERYIRLPERSERGPEGSGLGLTIARQLVQLLGGRIWVEERPGGGSIFRFTARFEPARGQRHPSGASASLNLLGLRVLAVACEPTTRIVLREMLVDWGGAVVEACSAEEALSEVAQAGFAVAILDCHGLEMPILELAQKIVALGDAAPSVILVTLEPVDEAAARRAGVSARLLKPLRRRDLADALSLAVSGRQTWASTESTLPPVAERPLSILIVDDAPENRLLVEAYLRGQPHTLGLAKNGAEALERFAEQRWDVVLMDVQMPVMDGYVATRAMRKLETERGWPKAAILALTADAMPHHVEAALAAGCTSHLAKPLRRQALLVALSIAARQPRQAPAPAPVASAELVMVDPLIADLVPAFLDGRRRDLSAIDASLADGDLEALAAIGHTIRGIAGSYGFRRIGEMGSELEAYARAGDLDRLRRLREELAAHLERVRVVRRASDDAR